MILLIMKKNFKVQRDSQKPNLFVGWKIQFVLKEKNNFCYYMKQIK